MKENRIETEPKIEVKLATQDDWKACKDLRLESITLYPEVYGLTEEEFEEENNQSDEEWKKETDSETMFSVLAWDGSKAVGLGRTRRINNNSWFIRNGYVKKEFWGRGLQPRMIALRLLEITKRGGIKAITGVKVDNNKSIKNLESFGFKTFQTKLQNGEEFYMMELDNLNSPEVIKKINEVLNAG